MRHNLPCTFALLAASTLLFAVTPSSAETSRRPNLVFILADDLGYGDLGCFGCPDIRTPRLDRLARQGVRLTDSYSNGSICSPTRAAFMTGRYQQRIGLEWAVYYGVHGEGLPPEETSIARMIRQSGYATALCGKWHLGYDRRRAPNHHGFDHFFGLLGGNHHYFEHYDRKHKPDLFLNTEPVARRGYSTDLIADDAMRFIDAHAEKPFFLFAAFNAPHFPYQGPGDADRLVTPRKGWQTGTRKTYAAMVESLDTGVGRILDALDRHKLTGKTLVVFTSDNGGAKLSRNAPLAGGKGTLWEGGIRVPAIARWPGRLPAGTSSNVPHTTADWAATLVKLSGARPPENRPFDGIDLLPILAGRQPPPDRALFWRRSADPYRGNVQPQRAVRQGAWKYIDEPSGKRYLFDLSRDLGEKHNLAEAQPATADRLRALLDAWEKEIDPPLYDQRPKGRSRSKQPANASG